MKKIALYLLTTVTALSCSNAQNKEFSEESLSKKIISIDNKEISFSEILKKHNGKVTVIEVWASWCSDCVKAMPKVKEMQKAILAKDPRALPKFHDDGKLGPETAAAMTKLLIAISSAFKSQELLSTIGSSQEVGTTTLQVV
jgi:thiol-disulfide isomerase/thioredoxin